MNDHGGEGETTKTYSVNEDTGECETSCEGSWTHKLAPVSYNYSFTGDAGNATQSDSTSCGSDGGSTTTTYNGDCNSPEVTSEANKEYCHSKATFLGGGSVSYDCEDGIWSQTVMGFTTNGGAAGGSCPCSGSPVPEDAKPTKITYSDCTEVPPCSYEPCEDDCDPCTNCDFPDYPEWTTPGDEPAELTRGQGRDSTASRDFAEGDVRKAETKVKWRVKHAPTGTCYLKVWMRKTTTLFGNPNATPPTEDDITVDDDGDPYEWNGTGNPCIDTPDDGADSESNKIVGDENELDPPDENGFVTIEVLKYSCVKNYEPDVTDEENPQPNGFPDPAWEAEAP